MLIDSLKFAMLQLYTHMLLQYNTNRSSYILTIPLTIL